MPVRSPVTKKARISASLSLPPAYNPVRYLSAERFVEVVAVKPRHPVELRANANLMIKHQVDQALAVDQHQAFDRACKVDGLGGEAGGGDEHAAPRFLPGQGTVKGLQFGAADRALPALGLHVDCWR